MAKYDRNGCLIKVVEKLRDGQYLIRRFFTGKAYLDDEEDSFTGDGLFIVNDVFDDPPTEKLAQTVKELWED